VIDRPPAMRDHVLLQAGAARGPFVDDEGVQKRVVLVVNYVSVLGE
jgi:hypothetical protein